MRKEGILFISKSNSQLYHYLLTLGVSVAADIYLSKAHCLKQNQTMPNGNVYLVSSPIKKSNLQFYLEGIFLTVV